MALTADSWLVKVTGEYSVIDRTSMSSLPRLGTKAGKCCSGCEMCHCTLEPIAITLGLLKPRPASIHSWTGKGLPLLAANAAAGKGVGGDEAYVLPQVALVKHTGLQNKTKTDSDGRGTCREDWDRRELRESGCV